MIIIIKNVFIVYFQIRNKRHLITITRYYVVPRFKRRHLSSFNNHFQIADPSHLGQAATGNLNCVPEKRPADSEMSVG